MRYIALLGCHKRPLANDRVCLVSKRLNQAREGWCIVTKMPTLCLFVHRSLKLRLAENGLTQPCEATVLLGMFGGRAIAKAIEVDGNLAIAPRRSDPFKLISDWMGSGIAFSVDGNGCHVVRDPSGMVPCYFTATKDEVLTCSHVEDLRIAMSSALTVDNEYLAAYTAFPTVVTRRTGFTGIKELFAGEILQYENDSPEVIRAWQPGTVLRKREHENNGDSAPAASIIDTIAEAVEELVCPNGKLLVELSGGLDSALILWALRQSGRNDVVAVNYFSSESDSLNDERIFARQSALQSEVELIEIDISTSKIKMDDLLQLSTYGNQLDARPTALDFHERSRRALMDLAKNINATEFWTGTGGNQVLGELPTEIILAQGMRDGQVKIGTAFRRLAHMARTPGFSLSSLFLRTLCLAYAPRKADWLPLLAGVEQKISGAWGGQVTREIARDNPWLEEALAFGPAHACHASLMANATRLTTRLSRYYPLLGVQALNSRLIQERMLQVPVEELSTIDTDRQHVRSASRGVLADSAVTPRRGATSHGEMLRFLKAERKSITELLRDGYLIRSRVIEPSALENNLSTMGFLPSAALAIERVLSAEAWLERWKSFDGRFGNT